MSANQRREFRRWVIILANPVKPFLPFRFSWHTPRPNSSNSHCAPYRLKHQIYHFLRSDKTNFRTSQKIGVKFQYWTSPQIKLKGISTLLTSFYLDLLFCQKISIYKKRKTKNSASTNTSLFKFHSVKYYNKTIGKLSVVITSSEFCRRKERILAHQTKDGRIRVSGKNRLLLNLFSTKINERILKILPQMIDNSLYDVRNVSTVNILQWQA